MSREIKVGDRVKITSNSGGGNYQIGKYYIITTVNRNTGSTPTCQAKDMKTGVVGNWIFASDCKLAAETLLSLKKEKRRLTTELKAIVSKIAYVTETGAKELNEEEWVMNHAFDVLDAMTPRPATRSERAAAMTKILQELGHLK